MIEYFKIGKVVATFGLRGEVLLKHFLGKKTSLRGLQAIFIEEQKDSFLPWFINAVRIKSRDEIFLQLQDVSTREAAFKLTQKEVWIPEADFKKFSAKSSPINFLNFEIVDNNKILGKVTEVIEQPHQMLCKIEINNKEVLIPLNESTIKKVDKKYRQIIVQLPAGLLEIYE